MSIIHLVDFSAIATSCNWIISASVLMLVTLVLVAVVVGVIDLIASWRDWDFAEKVVAFQPLPVFEDEWEAMSLMAALNEWEETLMGLTAHDQLTYSPPQEVLSIVRVSAPRRHVIKICSPGYMIPGVPVFVHGEPPVRVRCC